MAVGAPLGVHVTPLQRYLDTFRGLPRDVWILALVAFVHRAGTMVLPFLSLWLTVELELPMTTVGAVLTAYGLGGIAGSWLGGHGTDRLGAVRTMHLTLWGAAAGFLALLLTDAGDVLPWVAGFAAAAGEGFRPAAMTAILNRTPPESQPRAMAAVRLAINLGMAIGPAIGGLLAVVDYAWLFAVDAVTCVAASALLGALLRGRSSAFAPPAGHDRTRATFFRNADFWFLLAGSFFVAAAFFQLLGVYPVWLKEVAGFREDGIGRLLALNALLIVVFEMPLVAWAEGTGRRATFATLGCVAVCLGFAATGFSTSVLWIAATVVFWSFGEMLGLPLYNVLVAAVSNESDRGRAVGVYMMSWSIALVVAPAGGIALYRTFGSRALWLSVGALAVPVLLIGLRLIRRLDAVDPVPPA